MAIKSLKSGLLTRDIQVGNAVILPGDYESIASGPGSLAGITFSNIPQTFQHLQLRCNIRSTAGGAYDAWFLLPNESNVTDTFMSHWLRADGSTVVSTSNPQGNTSLMQGVPIPSSTSLSGVFGSIIIDILDYRNTNKFKVVRMIGGFDNNGDGQISVGSSLWTSTSAITQLRTGGWNGAVADNSYWSLYGIRG